MPEEQILELVKEFFNEGGIREDGSCSEYCGELQKFIEFADKVYLTGWREGYGLCLKNLNPSIEDLIESTKAENERRLRTLE